MPEVSKAQFGNVVHANFGNATNFSPRGALPHQGDELDEPVCEDCNMGGAGFGVKQRMDPIQKRPRQLCQTCQHGLQKEAEWQEADRAERRAQFSVVK